MEAPISATGISLISQPVDAMIDIVFVQGLHGHPQRTWSLDTRLSQKASGYAKTSDTRPSRRDKLFNFPRRFSKCKDLPSGDDVNEENSNVAEDGQREVFWPRDLLKEDFPMARIMTFGYNSKIIQVFEATNQSNIFSHARNLLYELESKRRLAPDRHLIFVVHSLGGIIVKEALRRSEVDPDPKIKKYSIQRREYFFWAPHTGEVKTGLPSERVSSRLQAFYLVWTQTTKLFMHYCLLDQNLIFVENRLSLNRCLTRVDLLSELFKSRKVSQIVPPDSSSLDHPNQRSFMVDADHMEMVKFSGRHDKPYEMVCADISELVSNAQNELQDQRGRTGKLSGMDYMKQIPLSSRIRLPNQTGKILKDGDVTAESLEWFSNSPEFRSWISTDDSTFLWLHGLPGEGKTTVASYIRQSFPMSEEFSREKDIASIFCSRRIETETEMVWSLALQLSCRIDRANAEQKIFALPEFPSDCSEEVDLTRDLWKLLKVLIILLPGNEVFFILDGIDEILAGTRSQFLHSLHCLEEDIRGKAIIRILISSRDYPDIREALGHYSTIEKGKEWKECLNTFRFEEWNTRENKISDAHEGGTWLSSSKDYKEWLANPISDLLWIAGKPGSGKSTLVKLIMKRLQAEHSDSNSRKAGIHGSPHNSEFFNEKNTIISSFYYSFRGGYTEMSHELMLRSIAYQIFGQNDRLFALIRDRFRRAKSERSLWSYQDLKSVLLSLHDTPFHIKVFIAVDGLDESDNALRDDVLNFFSALVTSKSGCILKILLASRPENDIRPWMNRARHVALEKMNHEDIRAVVKSGIQKLEQSRQSVLDHGIAPLELRDQKEIFTAAGDYILENSRGVFLWAALVLRELEKILRWGGFSLEDIDDCVRSLPRELGGSQGFYAVMVEKLLGQTDVRLGHEARGRRIFAWVTFSTRPLFFSELRDALAIPSKLTEEVNPATFDIARARPNDFDRGLSSLCGGFIEVRPTETMFDKPPERSVYVQLIHQTVREFLLGKDRLAQPYDMNEYVGDREIVFTCCRCIYLAFIAAIGQNEAGTTFSLARELAMFLSSWNLLPYALTDLITHLNHLGSKSLETLAEFEKLITVLKRKPTSYSSLLLSLWVQSQPWPKQLSIPAKPDVARKCLDSTLISAATEGLTNAVDILLILGASATQALNTASEHGHEKIVAISLERGADVNAYEGEYSTALQAASIHGHQEVVNLLLANGADVNAQGGEYGTAVQAASMRGHQEIMKFLVRCGADDNAQGGEYGTALQIASMRGDEKIVKLLIATGADVNVQGGKYGTAIQAASIHGHHEIIQILLEHGAIIRKYDTTL